MNLQMWKPSRLLILITALSGIGLLAGGCSSGRNLLRDFPHDDFDRIGYRLAWRSAADLAAGAGVDQMDVMDDVVVVHGTSNTISVIDAASGDRRWSDQPTAPLTRFVGNVRDGNRLLASTESEIFVYDIETSELLERQRLGEAVNTKPVLSSGVLVYGTSNGRVLGHLPSTGFSAWVNTFRSKGVIDSDPVAMGELVAVVSNPGAVMIVDPIARGASVARGSMYSGTTVPLGAATGILLVASEDHSLYAFDTQGQELWRERTGSPVRGRPIVLGDRVYCSLEGQLHALNISTGEVIWKAETIGGDVIARRGGNLLVWDDGQMDFVDPKDGSLVASIDLDFFQEVRTSSKDDPDLYATTSDGLIAKLIPSN